MSEKIENQPETEQKAATENGPASMDTTPADQPKADGEKMDVDNGPATPSTNSESQSQSGNQTDGNKPANENDESLETEKSSEQKMEDDVCIKIKTTFEYIRKLISN